MPCLRGMPPKWIYPAILLLLAPVVIVYAFFRGSLLIGVVFANVLIAISYILFMDADERKRKYEDLTYARIGIWVLVILIIIFSFFMGAMLIGIIAAFIVYKTLDYASKR
jgi:hypothetical protein